MKTRMKRTTNWYFEWNVLSKYEGALLNISLNLPTPKDKSFFFGIAIFTLNLFYVEIAYVKNDKYIDMVGNDYIPYE